MVMFMVIFFTYRFLYNKIFRLNKKDSFDNFIRYFIVINKFFIKGKQFDMLIKIYTLILKN